MHSFRHTQILCATALFALLPFLGCGGGASASAGGNPSATAPAIASFSAAQSSIAAGTGTILSYSFSNGTGTVTPGIGAVTSGGTTNIAPSATTTYTLTVTGSAGATATQALTVTVTPGAPATVTKSAGDAQTASPGAPLPNAPLVTVADSSGTPLVGVSVTFAVLEGGGHVANSATTTDSNGRATSGLWTMGAVKGLNRLAARVSGLPDQVFTATSAATSTDVRVAALNPLSGVVGETLTVAATVTSTYQLASVVASNGTNTVPLSLGTYGRYGTAAWVGSLSFGTKPRGSAAVTFTAMDVLGHSTDLVIPVTLDRAPIVTVAAPQAQALARPTIALSASCTDDDPAGPTSLTARVNGTVLASGVSSLATTLNLASYEGQSISVDITGIDSIGQQRTVSRSVYVDSSSTLSVTATLPGIVWDVLGSRVLYLDTSGAVPSLRITNTATGSIEVVESTTDLVGTWGCYGFLTPVGAVYVRGAAVMVYPYSWLYEWRGGVLTNLGGLNSSTSLVVSGNYAVYNTQIDDGTGDTPIWRRELVSGTSVKLISSAGNNSNDVAANGDVAYWAMTPNTGPNGGYDYNIYRYRSGVTTPLTFDPISVAVNTYPLTDGTNVIFRRQDKTTNTFRLMLHDGTRSTALSPASTIEPSQGRSYALAGGYVAYLVEDMAKKTQVWRHGPSGESQITLFGTSSTIDAIGPDGTVLFINQAATPRRYRAVPGAAIQDIGSTLGRVVYRDGGFVVLLGATVLGVNP